MDRGSWSTYNIHLNWVTRWMRRTRSIAERRVERTKESWAINLVGCRQTKFSVCWFIKNTMRKWNSNGVRIFQLDSKFYCWRFFIRAWNAPTHESTCEHTHERTHSHSAQWNMRFGKIASKKRLSIRPKLRLISIFRNEKFHRCNSLVVVGAVCHGRVSMKSPEKENKSK